jgi:hypothetical protein
VKKAKWGVLAVALAVTGCGLTPSKPAAPSATVNSPLAPAPISLPATRDPAPLAPQVVTYAREAAVNPQLLMAILYNESYKPHDPDSERAWQKIKPDAAFGVANMHEATFDQTKQGRPFAKLPDDPGLAIEAAAWYLHDLNAQLPSSHPRYTTDELLALGYNTGPGNMKAFAKGAKPGADAQSYVDRLHDNWDQAARALSHA